MDDDYVWSKEEWFEREIESAAGHVNRLIAWGFLIHGKDWIKAWSRYDLKWSDDDSGWLMIPSDRLEPFISAARANPEVFELAMFVYATRSENDKEVPKPLKRLTLEYLKREFSRPAGRRGRSQNWGRDYMIISTIYRLIAHSKAIRSGIPI